MGAGRVRLDEPALTSDYRDTRGRLIAGVCSPASTANGNEFAGGGTGQVAKSV